VNAKQKRIQQRYKVRFATELIETVHEMLTSLKEGKSTVDEQLSKCEEVRDTIRRIK
jgi:hypothetical protein